MPIRCRQVVEDTDPEARYSIDAIYGGPEYETLAALGSNCCIGYPTVAAKANKRCAAAMFERSQETFVGRASSAPQTVGWLCIIPALLLARRGIQRWDVDGNEYVDYALAFGPLLPGRRHPELTKATADVFEQGSTTFAPCHNLEYEATER